MNYKRKIQKRARTNIWCVYTHITNVHTHTHESKDGWLIVNLEFIKGGASVIDGAAGELGAAS